MSREKTSLHDAPNDEPSFVVESELSEKENLITSDEKKSASGEAEEDQIGLEKIHDESLPSENHNDEKDEKKEIADLENGDSNHEKKLKSVPIKKVALIALTSAAAVGIGISATLLMKSEQINNYVTFETGEDSGLLRANIEIAKINDQLSGLLMLPDAVSELKQSNEVMKDRIEQLREHIEEELQLFYKSSKDRESQLDSIRAELETVIRTQDGSIEDLKKLSDQMKVIKEQQEKETESIKAKLEDFAIQESISNAQEKKTESEEPNNDAANQNSASSRIGFLELTHIQTLGRQRVALFSDGISGAIQIVEGRSIGQYRVTEITSDSVVVVSPSGETMRIKVKGS